MIVRGPRLPRLAFQVPVDLILVGVVIGQSRMNLGQRQVAKLPRDFLWNQAHVVPLGDPANGDTRPCNARPAAAYLGATGDQGADLGDRCHRRRV